jgi:hypothetical protein
MPINSKYAFDDKTSHVSFVVVQGIFLANEVGVKRVSNVRDYSIY